MENSPNDHSAPNSTAALALEKTVLEIKRLQLELTRAEREPSWLARWHHVIPLFTVTIAVIGVWLTFAQLRQQQEQFLLNVKEERAARDAAEAIERARLLKSSELEIKKPFWEKQLDLYIQATDAAAAVASAKSDAARREAEARFWVLYLGPLAIVEDAGVEKTSERRVATAMIEFGRCLDGTLVCSKDELEVRSIKLAHSCRDSVRETWDVQFPKAPAPQEVAGTP